MTSWVGLCNPAVAAEVGVVRFWLVVGCVLCVMEVGVSGWGSRSKSCAHPVKYLS